MIASLVCSFFGTVGFSVLFNVPKKYYVGCGATGMLGWLCYCVMEPYTSDTVATFAATILVVLIARMLAVYMKTPITIFLVPGIFPLLPGANVYYTAYYLVTNNLAAASANGMTAVKIAFSMVLGIVLMFSVPREIFQISYWKERRSGKGTKEEE